MKKIISIILCLALILGLAAIVSAAETDLVKVDAPEAGVAYKLGLYQANKGEQLYFNGTTPEGKSYYLATTTDVNEAVDVYLESVDGGLRLYFMDGSTKTYIEMYAYFKDGSSYPSGSLKLTTSPKNIYSWDSTLSTLIYVYDDSNSFFMGTYKTYDTISVSSTYYITGDKASDVGVSQFVAQLYAPKEEPTTESTTEATEAPTTESTEATTTEATAAPSTEAPTTAPSTAAPSTEGTTAATEAKPVISKVTTPTTGTGYKMGFYQANLEKTLYFAGAMDGYYLATTENYDEAVEVYLEAVTGGYHLYFMDGTTKTYIDIIPRETDATKTNVVLTTTPSAVYVWNAEKGTFTTTVNEQDWYLGTYSNFSTVSPSKTSYIEDTTVIGVSQFPVNFYVKSVPNTGDNTISLIVALLAVSACGIAVLGKKKEF